jgi:hypothetical protein
MRDPYYGATMPFPVLSSLIGIVGRMKRSMPRRRHAGGGSATAPSTAPRARAQSRTPGASFLLILLAALLWPDVARAQEPGSSVTVIAGPGVSMSDRSAPIPRVQVTSDNPAFVGDRGDALGRLRVDLAISGLPGESVQGLDSVENWVSAELYGEFQRRVGDSGGSETMVIVRGGFITRILPGDKEPRQRFARLYGAGIRAQKREADGRVSRSIALLYGRDEIASPDRLHAGQLSLEGQVRLRKFGSRGEVTIVGDAHLQLGHHHGPGERDVMRLGLAVGWGG